MKELEQLYAIESGMAKMWFDLFRRFPMVEDAEHYFLEAMNWGCAAASTFQYLGEMADLFTAMKKDLGEEGFAELLKTLDQEGPMW